MILNSEQISNISSNQLKNMSDDEVRVTTAMIQAMSEDRQAQKEMFRRVTDFYYARYKPHYNAIFDPIIDDYDAIKDDMYPENSFFTRTVVNQMAMMYREKPKRKFLKNGEEVSEDEAEYYHQIYDWLSNRKDQTFNKMVKANGTCLYKVVFRNNRIEGDVFTPDLYDVVQNPKDMTQPIAIVYEMASTDSMNLTQQNGTKYIYWSDEEFKVIWFEQQKDQSNVTTTYPINYSYSAYDGDTENPYGIIPCITVTESELLSDYFDDENANVFDNADRSLTVKKTAKSETYVFQGFDILVLTTNDPDKYKNFKVSPRQLIRVDKGNPNQSDDRLEFLSPNDKITNLEDVYKKDYIANAMALGLEIGEGDVNSNMSGVAIALSKESQNKIINADRSKYEEFEIERWEIIKKVNNYHESESELMQKIPEDIEIAVEFEEVKIELGVQEKVQLKQFHIDNGLVSRFDLIREMNPEMSEDEIRDKIAEIDSERSIALMGEEQIPIEGEVETVGVEAEAQAKLRGTVGGVQGLLELQRSIAEGTTSYSAAVQTLFTFYGINDSEARSLLGSEQDIKDSLKRKELEEKVDTPSPE